MAVFSFQLEFAHLPFDSPGILAAARMGIPAFCNVLKHLLKDLCSMSLESCRLETGRGIFNNLYGFHKTDLQLIHIMKFTSLDHKPYNYIIEGQHRLPAEPRQEFCNERAMSVQNPDDSSIRHKLTRILTAVVKLGNRIFIFAGFWESFLSQIRWNRHCQAALLLEVSNRR